MIEMAERPIIYPIKVKIITEGEEEKLKQIDDELQKRTENHQLKLMTAYSYIMTISNQSLRMLKDVAKSTAAEAGIQKVLIGLQAAQAQVSVGITQAQAMAALATGNIPQYAFLQTIVALMEAGAIQSIANQIRAQQIKEEAEQVRNLWESYRS